MVSNDEHCQGAKFFMDMDGFGPFGYIVIILHWGIVACHIYICVNVLWWMTTCTDRVPNYVCGHGLMCTTLIHSYHASLRNCSMSYCLHTVFMCYSDMHLQGCQILHVLSESVNAKVKLYYEEHWNYLLSLGCIRCTKCYRGDDYFTMIILVYMLEYPVSIYLKWSLDICICWI